MYSVKPRVASSMVVHRIVWDSLAMRLESVGGSGTSNQKLLGAGQHNYGLICATDAPGFKNR